MSQFPRVRLRRLRQTAAWRRRFARPLPGPEKFIWPVFVREGRNCKEPVDAMPGQFRWSVDRLPEAIDELLAQGVTSVLIFGLPEPDAKSADGRGAAHEDGVVQRTIPALTQRYPNLLIFTDVCLCAYTEHGHCGPLAADGKVDNDAAIRLLAETALSHAAAGAHAVAPSAMMDGQVAAIRARLDDAHRTDTIIMSYSTKFASAMYGPFRDAEQSAPAHGDRKGYQAPCDDPRQALRESRLDEAEGADILMVKPSLFYLDILSRLRDETELPLAAYNVSGEYAMLLAAAERGWGDLRAMVRESVSALARAGVDLVISYWANQYREMFADD